MALYHDYRPQVMEEIVGQSHIVESLQGLGNGKVNHAYLMSGPRGTGKTTLARLIAKTINCQSENGKPCCQCLSCVSLASGSYPDLIEIDAASNRGIDDIRNLRDRVQYQTIDGEYKVIIIDEAHMLTPQASNALLKTLEEPPKQVVIILCTTEPQKLLDTITSRCLRFRFRLIPEREILATLALVNVNERFDLEAATLQFLAEEARGSMRDGLSAIEFISLLPDRSYEAVRKIFGRADVGMIYKLMYYVGERDIPGAYSYLASIRDEVDMHSLTVDIVNWLRGLLFINVKADYVNPLLDKMRQQAIQFTVSDLTVALRRFSDIDYNPMFPTLGLELAIGELCLEMSEVEDF